MPGVFLFRGPLSLSAHQNRIRRFSLALVVLAAGIPSIARADVIYLKNGRKIVAEVTREDSKQVYYERGGGEFALPRSLVDRIEKVASPAAEPATGEGSARARTVSDLPLPETPPADASRNAESRVVKDDAIDEAYLQGLDNEFLRNPSAENRRRLAQGYQEAAIFLTRQGNPEAALAKYRHAHEFAPNDLALTLALAYLLVKERHHAEAIELLRPVASRFPNSADVPMLLGSAYYATEKLDMAIGEWKKALAIQDNPRVREAIAKAEQERSVAASYEELRSEHFLLRFEGRQVRTLGEEILKTLEEAYRDLQFQLDIYPRDPIVVLLYSDLAFRDITRLPNWVGAVNDGKIRVPVSGLSGVTLDLARILKHELTHSFVRQVTVDRCPVWFNEGLAQLEEGASTVAYGRNLSRALSTGATPPFAAIEGSFMNLPAEIVGMVYAKSLAALEYLRDTYGAGEIRRLLKLIPSNPDFNSLLQNELRLSYPSFEQEVTTYVDKRYGS